MSSTDSEITTAKAYRAGVRRPGHISVGRTAARSPAGPGTGSRSLKTYAHRIDGQADAASRRITDALGVQDAEPGPGGEPGGDSEQAS